jgi:ABC-type antimicrobial peptide transport system permease subunit
MSSSSDTGSNAESKLRKINLILKKELETISNNFSKIVGTRFKFENNKKSYMEWTVKFKMEMKRHKLEEILTTDPDIVIEDDTIDFELFDNKQDVVFHMIFACLPDPVVAVLSTLKQQKGFSAWNALRKFYIGNEKAYLNELETKFMNIRWEENESFPIYETKFESLLSELEIAGYPKEEFTKKLRFLEGIRLSSKVDDHNSHIYVTLNTTSKINDEKSYSEWLTAIRTEAQEIAEHKRIKGTKRNLNNNNNNDDSKVELNQINTSFSNGQNNNFKRTKFNTNSKLNNNNSNFNKSFSYNNNYNNKNSNYKSPCRNMLQSGSCSFGSACRFSHDTTNSNTNSNNNFNNNN